MKGTKRIALLLLSGLMVIAVAIVGAFVISTKKTSVHTVSPANTITGKCGDNVKYSLNTSTGVLDITGTGKMNNYDEEDDSYVPWYDRKEKIKTVNIENGVTSIGHDAFENCTYLTSVKIGDSVVSIGEDAFAECMSLTKITIPDSVTAIDKNAFGLCTNLKSVTIGKNVSYINAYTFDYCTKLTNIKVDENNKEYSSLDGNLYNKDKTTLIHYDMGKTDTSFIIPNSVTKIGKSAFSGCEKLKSITIPDGVTSIGDVAFYDCTNLTSVNIPNSVTDIYSWSFVYTGLYNDSSNWEDGVLYIDNCLISVKLDRVDDEEDAVIFDLKEYTVKAGTRLIANKAFYICEGFNCKSLKKINIPDSVQTIGKCAFFDCEKLANITVDENNPNYSSLDGSLYNKNKATLIQYAVGKTDTSFTIPDTVKTIGEGSFDSCASLKKVYIPVSVTSIEAGAFVDSKIKNVYYSGTKEEWNNITIGDNNKYFKKFAVKYNYNDN